VLVDLSTGTETARYEFDGTPTGIGSDGRLLWCPDNEAKPLVRLEAA
jgi:hypothetical protein